MDARELRIGNWVFYLDSPNKVCAIESPKPNKSYLWDGKWIIEINPPDVFNVTIDQLNPIPLTEEWLTRFGFEKDSEFWYSIRFACYTEMGGDRIYKLSINPEIGKCIVGFVGYYGAPIKDVEGSGFAMSDYLVQYVHQLQNLYFALTGAELEIKDAKDILK